MTALIQIPCPRLEFRWEPMTDDAQYNWRCIYSLVIPLKSADIRGKDGYAEEGEEIKAKEQVGRQASFPATLIQLELSNFETGAITCVIRAVKTLGASARSPARAGT